jgi:hypothetical protein
MNVYLADFVCYEGTTSATGGDRQKRPIVVVENDKKSTGSDFPAPTKRNDDNPG